MLPLLFVYRSYHRSSLPARERLARSGPAGKVMFVWILSLPVHKHSVYFARGGVVSSWIFPSKCGNKNEAGPMLLCHVKIQFSWFISVSYLALSLLLIFQVKTSSCISSVEVHFFFPRHTAHKAFRVCACVPSEKRLEARCRRLLKQTDVYSLLKYKLEAQVKIAKPNEQFGR